MSNSAQINLLSMDNMAILHLVIRHSRISMENLSHMIDHQGMVKKNNNKLINFSN